MVPLHVQQHGEGITRHPVEQGHPFEEARSAPADRLGKELERRGSHQVHEPEQLPSP